MVQATTPMYPMRHFEPWSRTCLGQHWVVVSGGPGLPNLWCIINYWGGPRLDSRLVPLRSHWCHWSSASATSCHPSYHRAVQLQAVFVETAHPKVSHPFAWFDFSCWKITEIHISYYFIKLPPKLSSICLTLINYFFYARTLHSHNSRSPQ